MNNCEIGIRDGDGDWSKGLLGRGEGNQFDFNNLFTLYN
jgi:hypothetical protein